MGTNKALIWVWGPFGPHLKSIFGIFLESPFWDPFLGTHFGPWYAPFGPGTNGARMAQGFQTGMGGYGTQAKKAALGHMRVTCAEPSFEHFLEMWPPGDSM